MEKPKKRIILKKVDFIILAIVLTVASLFTFLFLGNTDSPKSAVTFNTGTSNYQTESASFEIVGFNKQQIQVWCYINSMGKFDETSKYISVYIYDGVSSRQNIGSLSLNEYNLYGYYQIPISIPQGYENYSYIQLETNAIKISVSEFVFINTSDFRPYVVSSSFGSVQGKDYSVLVDERHTFTNKNDSFYKMQAGEADMLVGTQELMSGDYMTRYQTLPLNKGLTALGMMMFGNDLFGFRFMSALFGVLTVAAVYLLARAIFKKTYVSAILSFLYILLGTSVYTFRLASMYNYMTLFILCGFLFITMFANANKRADINLSSYVLICLSAISFSLSISINLWAVSALIGGFLIFAYHMIDRTVDGKNVEGDGEKKILKKQNIIAFSSGIASYIIFPALLYFIFYTIGFSNKFMYDSHLSYVKYINLFEFFWENQRYIFNGLMQKSGTGNMWLWLTGFGNVSAMSQRMFLQNMAVCILSLICMGYYIFYLSTKGGKNKDSQLYASNKRIMMILFTGFLSCIFPYLFQYQGVNISAFLPASVFFIGFLALFMRQMIYSSKDVMFSIKSSKASENGAILKVSRGMFLSAVAILLCVIVFAIFAKGFLGII